MRSYVEHANMSVVDAQKTIHFLTSAIPEWRIRGQGKIDNWFGRAIEWFHVGDEQSYIAVNSGGEGQASNWKAHFTGVKHVGIVVPDVDKVVERLEQAGYAIDHWGGDHPHRKSVYFLEGNGFQFEFIEYLSADAHLRNDYTQ
ncbi:VOC family protein [Vibrio navarrensis]|uniref:VOC family protein n=1 Tax=Vibrio navarrensis TaxID=29495 RepID=A0AAI9CRL8_9VIBR|nr:VOC family protein [Vibrio navarrensis]ELN6931293.1 VOC family protein [Vibrio navarrensis]